MLEEFSNMKSAHCSTFRICVLPLLALPTYYQGKKKDIIVFRLIIEYSSLRDFL
jgi:hypothetical protein